MHGYMMPPSTSIIKLKIAITWLHYAPTKDTDPPVNICNSRLLSNPNSAARGRTNVRVRGDDGHEESAVVDFVPDLLIPGVPAPQLTLIEKDLDAGRT